MRASVPQAALRAAPPCPAGRPPRRISASGHHAREADGVEAGLSGLGVAHHQAERIATAPHRGAHADLAPGLTTVSCGRRPPARLTHAQTWQPPGVCRPRRSSTPSPTTESCPQVRAGHEVSRRRRTGWGRPPRPWWTETYSRMTLPQPTRAPVPASSPSQAAGWRAGTPLGGVSRGFAWGPIQLLVADAAGAEPAQCITDRLRCRRPGGTASADDGGGMASDCPAVLTIRLPARRSAILNLAVRLSPHAVEPTVNHRADTAVGIELRPPDTSGAFELTGRYPVLRITKHCGVQNAYRNLNTTSSALSSP